MPANLTIDPLRVPTYEAPFRDDEALRGQLLTLIADSISQMSNSKLQEVARFIDLVENDQGCATPAEELITGLVNNHYWCGGLTPAIVEHELEEFRESFEDAVRAAKRLQQMHPGLLTAANE